MKLINMKINKLLYNIRIFKDAKNDKNKLLKLNKINVSPYKNLISVITKFGKHIFNISKEGLIIFNNDYNKIRYNKRNKTYKIRIDFDIWVLISMKILSLDR